jgi:hypothetical protein
VADDINREQRLIGGLAYPSSVCSPIRVLSR